MSELVVFLSLFRIGKNAVSLGCFLKLCFRLLISGVHIGMVLFCQLTVSRLYCSFVRILIYAQYLIIISLISHNFFTSLTHMSS